MKYSSIQPATFIERPNRFIARVEIAGREETVHVRNTGRCREILIPGTSVFLEDIGRDNPKGNPIRKTRFSLISAYKGERLINIDSQIPNKVVAEAIQEGALELMTPVTRLKPETVFGESRFDLYFETHTGKGFIEVKGVTLEQDGVSLFPDAPTPRGTKHLNEMIKAVSEGYQGYVLFLIQMRDIHGFRPNETMDPDFASALRKAARHGVKILAYDSTITPEGIWLRAPVPINL
ncbi:MAG TPA: DNA/RNA nuclease SfsA [Bacillota bacterium]|nr:DNA/RNA nuclease SfsA [Bacillota bacterium]